MRDCTASVSLAQACRGGAGSAPAAAESITHPTRPPQLPPKYIYLSIYLSIYLYLKRDFLFLHNYNNFGQEQLQDVLEAEDWIGYLLTRHSSPDLDSTLTI